MVNTSMQKSVEKASSRYLQVVMEGRQGESLPWIRSSTKTWHRWCNLRTRFTSGILRSNQRLLLWSTKTHFKKLKLIQKWNLRVIKPRPSNGRARITLEGHSNTHLSSQMEPLSTWLPSTELPKTRMKSQMRMKKSLRSSWLKYTIRKKDLNLSRWSLLWGGNLKHLLSNRTILSSGFNRLNGPPTESCSHVLLRIESFGTLAFLLVNLCVSCSQSGMQTLLWSMTHFLISLSTSKEMMAHLNTQSSLSLISKWSINRKELLNSSRSTKSCCLTKRRKALRRIPNYLVSIWLSKSCRE